MAANKGNRPKPKPDGREARVTGVKTPQDRMKALADHGWEETGGGKVEGWEEGKEVQGVVVRVKDGKFGPLVVIRDGDGSVRTLGAPTVLANRLDAFTPGDGIYIGCRGTLTTEGGREAWDFVVMRCAKEKLAQQEDIPF